MLVLARRASQRFRLFSSPEKCSYIYPMAQRSSQDYLNLTMREVLGTNRQCIRPRLPGIIGYMRCGPGPKDQPRIYGQSKAAKRTFDSGYVVEHIPLNAVRWPKGPAKYLWAAIDRQNIFSWPRLMIQPQLTGYTIGTDRLFLVTSFFNRKNSYIKSLLIKHGKGALKQYGPPPLHLYMKFSPKNFLACRPPQLNSLPKKAHQNRSRFFFSKGAWLPDQCSLDDVFRCQVILLEHIVRLPVTQLRGVAAVVDCSGLSMTQAYYLTPTHIKRMISIIQEVFPLRFKALHFVNEPNIFDWIFSFVRPFLSETLQGRLHFHGDNLASLYEYIPQESLPEELGGPLSPLDNTTLVENLKSQEEYFKDNFSYGYLPVEEPVTTVAQSSGSMLDAVSGMGSFLGGYYRRMCID
ncbi:unnamed protein product, partial [Meganyctiphanes norvegica]